MSQAEENKETGADITPVNPGINPVGEVQGDEPRRSDIFDKINAIPLDEGQGGIVFTAPKKRKKKKKQIKQSKGAFFTRFLFKLNTPIKCSFFS